MYAWKGNKAREREQLLNEKPLKLCYHTRNNNKNNTFFFTEMRIVVVVDVDMGRNTMKSQTQIHITMKKKK